MRREIIHVLAATVWMAALGAAVTCLLEQPDLFRLTWLAGVVVVCLLHWRWALKGEQR